MITKTLSLDTTTELKEIHGIKVNGKEFFLRELNGADRDSYQSKNTSRIKFEKGEMAGMKDMNGVQAELLALSLREKPDGNRTLSVAELQKWPASLLSTLYKEARELSALGKDDDEVEKAKNDSLASASSGSSSPSASATPSESSSSS